MCAWPMVSIRDLVDNSARICASDVRTHWLLNLDQIEAGTGRVLNKERVQEDRIGSSTHAFEAGTVLYSKLRPYLNKVVVADEAGYATTELVPIRCRPDIADPHYLAHFLRSPTFVSFATEAVAGAKMPRMVMGAFWAYELPLPPLTEQRRIAAILDQADALRAKRRESLAQLDRLTQAIFIDMFGDPLTNPMGWPEVLLEKLGSVVTGNTPSRDDHANFGNVIEWVKSDNLNTSRYYVTRAAEGLSEIGRRKARTAPADSVLVTCIAGSPECIGNCAMTDREVAFNQQINAFLPSVGNPHYYLALFRVGKKLIQQASTNGMKGMVSKGRFEQIIVMSPPEELQKVFARRVLDTVALKDRQTKSLEQLDELFASLQGRAFRGEL